MSLGLALQKMALRAVAYSGLPAFYGRRHAGIGAILSFHRIYRPQGPYEFGNQRSSISSAAFRQIIQDLRKRDYEFVTMTELVRRLELPRPTGRRFVCLTFDDGWQDTYSEAFMICRELSVPMVVYVMTGAIARTAPMWWLGLEQAVASHDRVMTCIDGRSETHKTRTAAQKRRAYSRLANWLANAAPADCEAFCDALAANYGIDVTALTARHTLTPAMIAEMQSSGLVEFGAHTVNHPSLRNLTPAAACQEMAMSRAFLEKLLGNRVVHFAYPYGAAHAAGPREYDFCRELGFASGVTTRSRTLVAEDRHRVHALPRLTLNGNFQDVPLLQLLLSGTLPRLRSLLGGATA